MPFHSSHIGYQPDESAITATHPVSVAIPGFTGTSAPVVHGLYDPMASAGPDWVALVAAGRCLTTATT